MGVTLRPMWRVLKKVWRGWLAVAHVLGTVQMVIILTLVYWALMPLLFIPFGLISDPLRVWRRRRTNWLLRAVPPASVESMRRQG